MSDIPKSVGETLTNIAKPNALASEIRLLLAPKLKLAISAHPELANSVFR